MNILILNGSPRPEGNTAKMIEAFTETAGANNKITRIDVCSKDIRGCRACEFCHTTGKGQCIQNDDMNAIYGPLKEVELLVIASPIYYHNISGQLKCAIDRFYSAAFPKGPEKLKKVAMILCSGDKGVYDGALFSFKGDFVGYLKLEDAGVITVAGNVTEEDLEKARELGREIK